MTFPSLPGENVLHVRDADTQNKIYHALELQFGKRYPWYDQSTARLSHWVFVLQFFSYRSSFPFFFLVQKALILSSKHTFSVIIKWKFPVILRPVPVKNAGDAQVCLFRL